MRRFKMHNCKLTQSSFIDLSLDEIPPARTTQLLAELNACPACRDEYAAVTSTLHRSGQALRASLPGEEFWSGYHARLNAKLSEPPALAGGHKDLNQTIPHRLLAIPHPLTQIVLTIQTWFGRMWLLLMRTVTSSVRVPVPVALGLLLIFGVSVVFMRTRGPVNAALSTQLPTVETRTINVPVIQEKVVTRVVYIEKKGRRSRSGANEVAQPSGLSGSVARIRSDAPVGAAMSLAGFKPTDQIKLTITKGSYRDEK
jgi:hypothetical protein